MSYRIGRWEGGATAPTSSPPTLRFFVGCGGFRIPNPDWTPRGPRMEPERTLNGPRTDPERTPNGPRTDSERTLNGAQTDPEQTPNGLNYVKYFFYQLLGFDVIPNPSQTQLDKD